MAKLTNIQAIIKEIQKIKIEMGALSVGDVFVESDKYKAMQLFCERKHEIMEAIQEAIKTAEEVEQELIDNIYKLKTFDTSQEVIDALRSWYVVDEDKCGKCACHKDKN
jgi:predicted nucleotide-binding protein (sugar kinase/HSP70/actin superfamily)